MSERRTHSYHISSKSGSFTTFQDAVKYANALRCNLKRYVEKNDFACAVFIGCSQTDTQKGTIKVGCRGRKMYISKEGGKDELLNPHIHIVVLANPGKTICQYICDHICKRTGKKPWSEKADDYLENLISYGMRQSLEERTYCHNLEVLTQSQLQEYLERFERCNVDRGGISPVFKNVSDAYFQSQQYSKGKYDVDPFTNSDMTETSQALDNTIDLLHRDSEEQLECNNININKYKDINIDTDNPPTNEDTYIPTIQHNLSKPNNVIARFLLPLFSNTSLSNTVFSRPLFPKKLFSRIISIIPIKYNSLNRYSLNGQVVFNSS